MFPYPSTPGYNFFLPTLVLVLLFVAFIAWIIVPPEYRRAVWFFALFIPFHMALAPTVGYYAFMVYWGSSASSQSPSGLSLLVLIVGFVLNLPLLSFAVPLIGKFPRGLMPWFLLLNSVLFTTMVYILFRLWKRPSTRPA